MTEQWVANRVADEAIRLSRPDTTDTFTFRHDLTLPEVEQVIERYEAMRDLLLREQKDESALVDELVLAGWGTRVPHSFADDRRDVVRRILAAQKKRAES